MQRKISGLVAGSVITSVLLVGGTAFAQTATPSAPTQGHGWGRAGMMGKMPGVFGTVAAINGASITVQSKGFGPNATATTYTVDATSATVMKDGVTSSVGNISVGDTVMVQGTVSGSSVTATTIRDGKMGGRGKMMGGSQRPQASSTQVVQGNGQPIVGGAITAVNGTTLTITNKSNVTFTVDAATATIEKAGAASTIASLAVGDNVIVQGTVNGNSITASSVIDSGNATTPTPGGAGAQRPSRGGFMGAIGGFFRHMFGFF